MARTKSEKERDTARGYTDANMAAVRDNPAWTPEMFAEAKPLAEILPDLAASLRSRGKQKAPTKTPVSIRLEQAVIDRFKAEGPAGRSGWARF